MCGSLWHIMLHFYWLQAGGTVTANDMPISCIHRRSNHVWWIAGPFIYTWLSDVICWTGCYNANCRLILDYSIIFSKAKIMLPLWWIRHCFVKKYGGSGGTGPNIRTLTLEVSEYIRTVHPTRCNVSQFIYFCKTLYMFQTGFSVHHQQLKTAHTALGICQTVTATCCWPGQASSR